MTETAPRIDLGPRNSPADPAAERALLGAAILYPDALDELLELLDDSDWFQPAHRIVWEALLELSRHGRPIDAVTVIATLTQREQLHDIGGEEVVLELIAQAVGPASIREYARLVRDAATQRAVIHVARDLLDRAGRRVESGDALLEEAEASLLAVRRPDRSSRALDIGSLAEAAVAAAERARASGAKVTGIATGYPDLDDYTCGWQPGSLVVLAARPSMGKSTLALNIALRVAQQGTPTLLVSLEVSGTELSYQVAAHLGRVDSRALKIGRLTEEEFARTREASRAHRALPLHIDDRSELTPIGLRARLRTQRRESGIGLVIVDYLQLMSGGGKHESRQQEVSAISRALKATAKEFSIPIIACAQLNRGVEAREDKRPRMSDLRESGAIEQDADAILLLHREDYYAPTETNKGLASVIVAKNRFGRTGEVQFVYLREQSRFEPYAGPRQAMR